jgi:hypothetical protein
MPLSGTSRIYHGGGSGGRGGFPSVPTVTEKFLFERIWIPTNDFKAVTSNPPNGPSTRVLPNGVNEFVWIFSPSELDIAFAHFCLPSRYWTYVVAAPTNLNVKIYWYTDTTAATIVSWRLILGYWRNGESMNVVPPFFSDLNQAAGTQYTIKVSEYNNFPLWNPSGSVLNTEGSFYLKVARDGASAQDTFGGEAHLIGASVEIPLKYP